MDIFIYFYLGCFVFGVILTIADFMLGNTTNPTELEDNEIVAGAVICAIIWFGVGGFIGTLAGTENWWSLPGALLFAVVSYFVALYLFRRNNSQVTQTMLDDDLRGQIARVTTPIIGNAPGEIIFSRSGSSLLCIAYSHSGGTHDSDSSVVIVRHEHGVVFVDNLENMLKEANANKWLFFQSNE
jgi:membrane protein implicated in regulation of membrane protease activity